MTDPIRHYLSQIREIRARQIAKSKTVEGKQIRVQGYQKGLLEKTIRAKREKARREGQYQSGMGMNAGCMAAVRRRTDGSLARSHTPRHSLNNSAS
mgnify:CR=1 FL=1